MTNDIHFVQVFVLKLEKKKTIFRYWKAKIDYYCIFVDLASLFYSIATQKIGYHKIEVALHLIPVAWPYFQGWMLIQGSSYLLLFS